MPKKLTPDEAREALLKLAYRRERPVLVGEATLVLGEYWSLAETGALLWDLVHEGALRAATIWEYGHFDIRIESDAFLSAGVKERHGPTKATKPADTNCQPPPPLAEDTPVVVPKLRIPIIKKQQPVALDTEKRNRPTLPARRKRGVRPRFLIDVDEVLADFAGEAINVVSQVLGRPWGFDDAPQDSWDIFRDLEPEVMKEADAIMNAPGWCASLKVKEGSQEFVKVLRKLCDVYPCTSHKHSPAWVYERDIWLMEHFQFQRGDIVHTAAKFVCGGDFFLDDKPSHVIKWQDHHPKGKAMLWSTEHNRRLQGYEDIRLHTFDEVLSVVRKELASLSPKVGTIE